MDQEDLGIREEREKGIREWDSLTLFKLIISFPITHNKLHTLIVWYDACLKTLNCFHCRDWSAKRIFAEVPGHQSIFRQKESYWWEH